MIKFPETTYVNKLVPKNSFYKHLSMNADIKAHFINDIERIVWAYKLAPSTMNVSVGKNVQEIVVFLIILKEKNVLMTYSFLLIKIFQDIQLLFYRTEMNNVY